MAIVDIISYQGFVREEMVSVSARVKLRVIMFSKETDCPSSHPPHIFQNRKAILFLPGWVTRLEVMHRIIKALIEENFVVYYIETRDKKSSQLPPDQIKPESFSIGKSAEDLKAILINYRLHETGYFLFSSSYGCLISAKFMYVQRDNETILPQKAVFLVPAIEISFTMWQKVVIRLPLLMQKVAVSIVEKYMKWRYANPEEPDLAYNFQAQLYDFDLKKVKLTTIALDKFGADLRSYISEISVQTLVIGASRDLLHPIEEVEALAKKMRNGQFIDLLSNKYTHDVLGGKIAAVYFNGQAFESQLANLY